MAESRGRSGVLGATATALFAVAVVFAAMAVFSMDNPGPVPDPVDYQAVHKADVARAHWEIALAEVQKKPEVGLSARDGKRWFEAQESAEQAVWAMEVGDLRVAASQYENAASSLRGMNIRRIQHEIDIEAARKEWETVLANGPPKASLDRYGGFYWIMAKSELKEGDIRRAAGKVNMAATYKAGTRRLKRAIRAVKAAESCSMRLYVNGGRSITFSPDGKTLTTLGRKRGTVSRWDLATGESILTAQGLDTDLMADALSPDGKTIACGGRDGVVTLWDVSTSENIQIFKGHKGSIRSVAISPDGKLLASGSSVAISSKGYRLASEGTDTNVKLWDVATGECLKTLDWHWQGVVMVAFSPDGKTLVSAAMVDPLALWDVATGKRLRTFARGRGGTPLAAFSRDGKMFAGPALRVLDPATGDRLQEIKDPDHGSTAIAISPDGKTVATGTKRGDVRLWDVATGDCFQLFDGHTSELKSIAFGPDGKTIASVASGGSVMFWQVQAYKPGSAIEPKLFEGWWGYIHGPGR
jgi:WD40 domain-containing protein